MVLRALTRRARDPVPRPFACFTSRSPSTYGAAQMKSILRSSFDLLLRSTRIRPRIVTRTPALSLTAAAVALTFSACEPTFAQGPDGVSSDNGNGQGHGQPVKVMIISMFGPEGRSGSTSSAPGRPFTWPDFLRIIPL